MELTTPQALELVTAPQNKKQIEAARRTESKLRVFTEELELDELQRENYWQELMLIVKARLENKTDRVLQFARYPLPCTQIADSILSDFFKVFEGKNRNFKIDADRDVSTLQKWIVDADLENWIEEKAKIVYRNKPCSFVVVDIDEKGKPYLLLVDSERLLDAQLAGPNGRCEYIVFLHSETETHRRYSVYDDKFYRVIENQKGTSAYTMLHERPHNIGYCPATAFVSQPANHKNYFKRRVVFSGALSKFEDWTTFDIYRNYVDSYAPFPVTEGPENKCPNERCTKGWIIEEVAVENKPDEIPTIKYHECPICKANKGNMVGPGTHIGIKVKAEKGVNDGSGVFRMITPETEKLKYTPEKLDDLEVEIRHKSVGLNNLDSMNEAMNELQTKGSFASMESVLLRTKKELDVLYKWTVETVARILHKDLKLKVDANFGTEFYLVTEADLQKRFKEAKDAGLPIEELLMIYLQIIETKYKGNPNKIERQKLLLQLDPYPLYTVNEIISLREKNLVDSYTLFYKINFLNFVSRFEVENVPITQFALALPPNERIKAIQETFKRYIAQIKIDEQKEQPAVAE